MQENQAGVKKFLRQIVVVNIEASDLTEAVKQTLYEEYLKANSER